MSGDGTLYFPSPGLRRAEEELADLAIGLGPAYGLAITVRRLPRRESNTADLMVCITPRLDKQFDAIALERTYAWLSRGWGLPSNLLGTQFMHKGDGPFEFLGATLLVPKPGYHFVAAKADGETLNFTRKFLEQSIVGPMEQENRRDALMFVVGFGADEVSFTLS